MIKIYLLYAQQVNNAKAKNDFTICNNGNGSSNDIYLIDSNSNGLNLANKYANTRPKNTCRFLSHGNRDINAIKRNPYKAQRGYIPVSPLGPAGTYTTWKGTTSEPVKVGVNQVEGQLLCFAANGTPNLIKHFVRNFTGIQATSGVPITSTLPH